ncbi:hypothetical protein V8C86DRAFT_2886571 [Haematococcus lacustris]
MGLTLSTLANTFKANAGTPPKVVLVPPFFEKENKDRDRFAYSSYDYQFSKRQLKYLFEDFYVAAGSSGVQGRLLWSPPADSRVTVEAAVGPGQADMSLRYQPLGPSQPHTFIDVRANPKRAGDVTLRAACLDPGSGVGVFATAPLAKKLSHTYTQVGLRYSSPDLTCGLITQPRTSSLSSMWLVGRYQGLLAGLQLRLDDLPLGSGSPGSPMASPRPALLPAGDWLQRHASFALAYEPSFSSKAGQGRFSASLELQEGRRLLISFFQHLAVSRSVVNPLEKPDVVGITNYIDIGLQITVPTSESPLPAGPHPSPGLAKSQLRPGSTYSSIVEADPPPATEQPPSPGESADSVDLAGSWQVNKNWLLKLRAGSESAAAVVALRSWSRVGALVAASAAYRYGDANVKWGLWLQLENFGALRYERGVAELGGRAVLQRHEASQVDLANAEGSGATVRLSAEPGDYNAAVPAQLTADFL